MRKFIYLARYYPPISSIASMRSWKLAKYIKNFNWEPVIIAGEEKEGVWNLPLPDVTVCRVPSRSTLDRLAREFQERSIQRADSGRLKSKTGERGGIRLARFAHRMAREIFAYPDEYSKWMHNSLRCAKKAIVRDQPKAIISTASPFSSHVVADKISRDFGIPWIADYRDLWSDSHLTDYSSLRRFFDRRLEKRTLRSASKVVTVSKPLADRLEDLLGRSVDVITNGFDQEDYDNYLSCSDKNNETNNVPVFSIVYTGSIYRGKQDLQPFFDAISFLVKNNMIDPLKIKVSFLGVDPRKLPPNLIEEDINSIVSFEDRIPVEQVIQRQLNSSVLLFLSWADLTQKGLYSGKIFEYLGARKPILAIPENPGSVVDDLIKDTNCGFVCSNSDRIAKAIKCWYDEFYENGRVSYLGYEDKIMEYDRKRQAKQFAVLLDSITEG
ncbi:MULTISPECIES: glycosyltransferase [Dethiosulfovibrio]|uniref:Glycosyltransferase n=2 Tax=Dethiosulfovibrio TaxID=47054 RepID=A0ABS9ELW5_9BACT|nr:MULTISPECIES: glycosyltransferase [Dethiosulfovibrio]MCF4113127.1 glycosyltransferase [Dethiosulfovibrio russensis]MCF4142191.1 glycosyltransferase [Dethiosulfovibrio marinus]MCF4145856.1 glycosyltransferase [Dethiosulfovibrio acidaminovorans]